MGLFPNEHETIEGVGRLLRTGYTTCVEVLAKCLDRIEEWEPRIKAWVRVDRAGAQEQARTLDEELAAGRDRGPLHGIPIGIKDVIDVAGLPTSAGFRPWADRIAERDATIVANLREAGAVILGKTVTTQFAWIDPPPTRNPWNLDRTPGGSSSGSAAAVAVGMCLGAVGTQTGGSIIRPASFCGVAGYKPGFGDLPSDGIVPLASSLDHPGPIARSVRDLVLLYGAMTLGSAVRWKKPTEYRDPPRLGRHRGLFDLKAEPVMRQAFEQAIDTLIAAGARLEESPWPEGFEDVHHQHRVIMASEAADWHEPLLAEHPDAYAPLIAALVREGLTLPAPEYVRCQRRQQWSRRSLGIRPVPEEDDSWPSPCVITPATIGPAPDRATTGDPVFNSPWSYFGLPALSFPIGLSPDGMPLAIQLIGCRAEEELFRAALWCEDVLRRAFRSRNQ